MREILKPYSELLFHTKWIELRSIKSPEMLINNYIYSHEIRCNGNIIAILPYKIVNGEVEYLLRKEATPCWNLNKPILCSITGGVEINETPSECAIKELLEETGYSITNSDLICLDTCFGTKSTDSLYYLFSVNLTFHNHKDLKKLHVETELEKQSGSEWVNEKFISSFNMVDPIVGMLFCRLKDRINKKHTNVPTIFGNSKIEIIVSNFPNIERLHEIISKYTKIYEINFNETSNGNMKIIINCNDITQNLSDICEELLNNNILVEEIYKKCAV